MMKFNIKNKINLIYNKNNINKMIYFKIYHKHKIKKNMMFTIYNKINKYRIILTKRYIFKFITIKYNL